MEQANEKPAKFQLNRTDINQIGFNLSTDKKLYQELISPFEDDQSRPHPLRVTIPEGFNTFDFQFQFEKIASRLQEDIFIYIFYNIIDERLQLQVARELIERGLNYHKTHKVWVRRKEMKFQYFNIKEWKYTDFEETVQDEDFFTKEDFTDKQK